MTEKLRICILCISLDLFSHNLTKYVYGLLAIFRLEYSAYIPYFRSKLRICVPKFESTQNLMRRKSDIL